MKTVPKILLASILLVCGAVAAEPEMLNCEGQTSDETYRFLSLFDARWRNAGDMIVVKKSKSGGGSAYRRFAAKDLRFELDRLGAVLVSAGSPRDRSGPYVDLVYRVDGRATAHLRHGEDFSFNMDSSALNGSTTGMATECQRVSLTADDAVGRKACFESYDFCAAFFRRHKRWPTGSAKDLSEIKWGPDIK